MVLVCGHAVERADKDRWRRDKSAGKPSESKERLCRMLNGELDSCFLRASLPSHFHSPSLIHIY